MRFRLFFVVWMLVLSHPDRVFGAESPYLPLAKTAIMDNSRLAPAWNPAGTKLAFYHDGTLFVFDLLSGRKKPLTKLASITNTCQLSWSPKASSLLLACPDKLTAMDAASGRAKLLLTSQSPLADAQYSPDGATITFIRDHALAQLPSSGGTVRSMTAAGSENLLIGEPDPLYAREFQLPTAYWWAPDCSAIAYLETDRSTSGTYARAGKELPIVKLKLLTTATGKVTEIASATPERPYIAGVSWLPDSKRIAYQFINRLQNQMDLNIYSVADSSSRQLFSDKDSYWINAPGAPVFFPDGAKFLITSERTGYRHVYLYDLAGQMQSDLTPGKTNVSGPVTLDATKKLIYFQALTDNLHDLQLFRAGFDGGPPQQITQEPGWHETRIASAGNAFVDTVSTAEIPPSVSIRAMDASQIAELTKARAETAPKVEWPEIRTHDKVQLPAMLWKPADFDPAKKYPLILYTFSGPRNNVVRNKWGGWQDAWNRYMTTKGFLVAAVDVRGSGGYAHLFEEYIHYRFGAQETADLREVFSYFSRLPYVDAKHIGIWGCDYGAHIAVHGMLEFPHGFAAGFADSPITDWTIYNAYFAERYLGLPARRINEYDDSSALENAKRLEGKLLVAASPANPYILIDQLTALQKALDEEGKKMDTLSFPNANYHEDPASLANLMNRMTDFFVAAL